MYATSDTEALLKMMASSDPGRRPRAPAPPAVPNTLLVNALGSQARTTKRAAIPPPPPPLPEPASLQSPRPQPSSGGMGAERLTPLDPVDPVATYPHIGRDVDSGVGDWTPSTSLKVNGSA